MVPVYVFDCVYCKNVRKDDKYRLVCGAYPKGSRKKSYTA